MSLWYDQTISDSTIGYIKTIDIRFAIVCCVGLECESSTSTNGL